MLQQRGSLLVRLCGQKRYRDLAIFAAIVLILVSALAYLRPDIHGSAVLYGGKTVPAVEDARRIPTDSQYAFLTLLTADKESGSDGDDVNEDHYYIHTRILTYQFCHAIGTKSKFPFVVLVTPEVDHRKRAQLERDGALVHEVKTVAPGLLLPSLERWEDVLTKFRLWELTQFERIAFIDADMFVFRNIDDIFDDPAVLVQQTCEDSGVPIPAGLPASFVFAGYAEQTLNHSYPPTEPGPEHDVPFPWYFNTGLFITKPDPMLYAYYVSLTRAPKGKPQDRSSLPFDSSLPDQNLLNYAHRWASIHDMDGIALLLNPEDRRTGCMPWAPLDAKWVTHHTTVDDLEGGAYAAHVHYWDPIHLDVQPYLLAKKAEMEAFYARREQLEDEGWKKEDWLQRAHEMGM
ncbi:glycosyltransferase family 8 protein [Teratosphaeria destructans]|uniref:Glycosyltransferase family 8 protein n=1 Tax=Teratosphaeria destructans TaxID=418781 RepID=A0A9W7SYG8_9PEZI|nr:glycosyltransferase family 8 protein [Teratosphaeria destructans]